MLSPFLACVLKNIFTVSAPLGRLSHKVAMSKQIKDPLQKKNSERKKKVVNPPPNLFDPLIFLTLKKWTSPYKIFFGTQSKFKVSTKKI